MHDKIGAFIRTHRERVSPESAGLPCGGRRRTPGLRREELAQLCGVSPTWLTWLEQGREVAPSGALLARLAEVLQLTAAERAYLFTLAERLDPHEDSGDGEAQGLDAIVAAIHAPAYILDRQWDALAWNGEAAALFTGWLAEQGGGRPNLLRYMFGAPGARELIADWPERAHRLVAEFRADAGKHAAQAPLSNLVDELARASADFAALWTRQEVAAREGGLRRFQHPARGALAYNQATLRLAHRPDLKLVMLLPSA